MKNRFIFASEWCNKYAIAPYFPGQANNSFFLYAKNDQPKRNKKPASSVNNLFILTPPM